MKTKAEIQEDQYLFPYHYLTYSPTSDFTLSHYLQWGLVHASYTEWITQKISTLAPSSILDAGCGDGRTLFELEQTGFAGERLHGIDISKRALFFAQAFTSTSSFSQHDIILRPTEQKYSLCVSVEVIEHIPTAEITKYITNIHASLEDRGLFLLTTPTTNIPVNKKHHQHFTEDTLQPHLDGKFEIISIEYLNYENYWGTLLGRFLANKYFIVNNQAIKNFIYKTYKKRYLKATKKTGSRIIILARKI